MDVGDTIVELEVEDGDGGGILDFEESDDGDGVVGDKNERDDRLCVGLEDKGRDDGLWILDRDGDDASQSVVVVDGVAVWGVCGMGDARLKESI